jgi:hypothetical protein
MQVALLLHCTAVVVCLRMLCFQTCCFSLFELAFVVIVYVQTAQLVLLQVAGLAVSYQRLQ